MESDDEKTNNTYTKVPDILEQEKDAKAIIKNYLRSKSAFVFIIFLGIVIALMVFCIMYVKKYNELIYSCLLAMTKRTTTVSLDITNSLKNTITIGCSLGDFVANLFNAYAFYDVIGDVAKISFQELYDCFNFWVPNNDYSSVYFTSNYYNEDNLEVLPFYLADYYPDDGYYDPPYSVPWGSMKIFGYNITLDDTFQFDTSGGGRKYMGTKNYIYIEKVYNTYNKLDLDDTKFIDYKNKFMKFLFENVKELTKLYKGSDVVSLAATSDIMMKYYQYYILINKIRREFSICNYFSYMPAIVNGKEPSKEDINTMVLWYKTNKSEDITLEEDMKTNFALTLLQNTYSWTYIGNKGQEISIENIKLKYNNGFIFYK